MEDRSSILLVEDSADDVLFFKRAMHEGGHDFDMHIVETGEAAIDYLRRACSGGEVPGFPVPKFLIMDNRLPGLQGGDLLFWMSKHAMYAVVPTVVLSGSARPHDVRRAFELGVHGYFVKPAAPKDLQSLLKMIFLYWAASKVPPVRKFEVTQPGAEPVQKQEQL